LHPIFIHRTGRGGRRGRKKKKRRGNDSFPRRPDHWGRRERKKKKNLTILENRLKKEKRRGRKGGR